FPGGTVDPALMQGGREDLDRPAIEDVTQDVEKAPGLEFWHDGGERTIERLVRRNAGGLCDPRIPGTHHQTHIDREHAERRVGCRAWFGHARPLARRRPAGFSTSATSELARRSRSSVPPRVRFTPAALRSVIWRTSTREVSRDADTMECSRFACVMSLI